jgi:pantoate--beta-alanine ligase
MKIYTDPHAMQQLSQDFGCRGSATGFVPTMGALHAGHLELCRRARQENDCVVASIFVNPTQFAANEDLARYPRPLEADLEKLREVGCDAVFTPDARAMYGDTDRLHGTWVDVTPFDEMWEGVTRPGHLRGVATIVAKLFNITLPKRAYFGEKDYQQLRVVQTMAHDLNFPVEIIGVETVREVDGLAMSSRNVYLTLEERRAATALYRAMCSGVEAARQGETDVAALGRVMSAILEAEPLLRTQYLTIVDAHSLTPLQHLQGETARILVAAYLGKTRLIDNMAV